MRWTAVILLLAGCKAVPAFNCTTDDQCTPSGVNGVCEATGFCSFPDPSCPTGYRYGEHAGDGLGDQCVGDNPMFDAEDLDTTPPPDGPLPPDSPPPPPDGPAPDAPVGGCIVVDTGCLELPTAPLDIFEGGVEFPADYSCGPATIDGSTGLMNITGIILDPFGAGPVNGADVEVYSDVLETDLLDSTTSSPGGGYSFSLPMGTPERLHFKISHGGAVDTYRLMEHFDPTTTDHSRNFALYTSDELDHFAVDEAEVPRDPANDVFFADLVDCNGNGVEHAIGLISTTSGVGNILPTLVPDQVSIYYDDASIPTPRTMRIETNRDGHFFVFEVTPKMAGDHYYIQAWGFLDDDDLTRGAFGLTLLSQFEVFSPGASYIRIGLPPTEPAP